MKSSAIADLRIEKSYWYVASPFSLWPAGPDDATKVVAEFMGRLFVAGVSAFSPITHVYPIAVAADLTGDDHDTWMARHRPLFEPAHGLIVCAMKGWRESRGVTDEIKWAREMGKPRFLVDVETLGWQALG